MADTNHGQQDWGAVVFDKRKPGGGSYGTTDKASLAKAQRTGNAVSEARQSGGGNKSASYVGSKNMRKLDESTEDFKREKASR
jgi:hypothetical protein